MPTAGSILYGKSNSPCAFPFQLQLDDQGSFFTFNECYFNEDQQIGTFLSTIAKYNKGHKTS